MFYTIIKIHKIWSAGLESVIFRYNGFMFCSADISILIDNALIKSDCYTLLL